jgi:site-specific DNA recombinase
MGLCSIVILKYEIEEAISKLGVEETKLREGIENYNGLVEDSLDIVQNLDKYYISKGTESKQRIVGSIFPEKLVFENNEYRTPRINKGVLLLCRGSRAFEGNKKRKHPKNGMLSCQVVL